MLYTRKHLSIELDTSIPTIIRWERLGLPVIRIGGIVRYSLPEVMKWLSLNEVARKLNERDA